MSRVGPHGCRFPPTTVVVERPVAFAVRSFTRICRTRARPTPFPVTSARVGILRTIDRASPLPLRPNEEGADFRALR